MLQIIAQGATETVTNDGGQNLVYIVAGIILALTGGGGIAGGAVIQKKRSNGNGFSQSRCDERHARIEADRQEFKQDVRDLHGKVEGMATDINKKLDRLIEHQMGQ